MIGVGWAGLAVARSLASRGLDVVILEAGSAVGGRSRTEIVAWEGREVPLDLGSYWVHGSGGNPVYAFAKEQGVPVAKVSGAALRRAVCIYAMLFEIRHVRLCDIFG